MKHRPDTALPAFRSANSTIEDHPSFLELHPAVLDHPPLLLQILLLLSLLKSPDLRQLPVDDHPAQLLPLACTPTPSDPPQHDLQHEQPKQNATSGFVADVDGCGNIEFDDQTASEWMYHRAKSPTMSP